MFKTSPKIRIFVKYGALVLLALGFLFTYSSTVTSGKEPEILDLLWENFTFLEDYASDTLSILDSKSVECLKLSSEVSSENIANVSDFKNAQNAKAKTQEVFPEMLSVLNIFNQILTSLDIKSVIIEPSLLYCMLRSSTKLLLQKREFDVTSYIRPGKIFSLGILNETAERLQEGAVISKFEASGFRPHFVQNPLADWMKDDSQETSATSLFTSHIFYQKDDYMIHLLVFYERKNFFWHAALSSVESRKLNLEDDAPFLQYNSAYERFSFVSLDLVDSSAASFYIPSLPHHFLLQTKTSVFLECNSSRILAASVKHPKSHSKLSVEQFNRRATISLRMLKSMLHPLLIDFWVWSGTMLGWYRQCDVIPYTSDVDFATWAKDLESLDLIIQLFLSNEHLVVKSRMGLIEEALEFQLDSHGLRVDLFFMYQIENGTWYSGHAPKRGYYFRYYHPNFTICSAELLGEKVNVPCETEEVITAEYGKDWQHPVSSWDYENSIKNRGPNIYWSKGKLEDAYQNY